MTLLGFEVFVFQIGECGIDNGREFFKTNVGCCVRNDATNVWSCIAKIEVRRSVWSRAKHLFFLNGNKLICCNRRRSGQQLTGN